jgi:hypothetical protein
LAAKYTDVPETDIGELDGATWPVWQSLLAWPPNDNKNSDGEHTLSK